MAKVGMPTDACNFSHSPYLDTYLTVDHDATPSVGVASPWRRKSNKIKPWQVDMLGLIRSWAGAVRVWRDGSECQLASRVM